MDCRTLEWKVAIPHLFIRIVNRASIRLALDRCGTFVMQDAGWGAVALEGADGRRYLAKSETGSSCLPG